MERCRTTRCTRAQQHFQIKLTNGLLHQLFIQCNSKERIQPWICQYEYIVTQGTWSLTAPSIARQEMLVIIAVIIPKV